MNDIAGIQGYEQAISSFAEASLKLDFDEINADFLDYLPGHNGKILDAGSGVGQNSATLAKRGYDVTAVEPLKAFLDIARQAHAGLEIRWLNDSLPYLNSLDAENKTFDFILLDGVWHHLSVQEREVCIKRFWQLLKIGGVCAISLRNGPAGAGKHVFPTDTKELVNLANVYGFDVVFIRENQPSKMKHKPDVIWSRVAIQKVR